MVCIKSRIFQKITIIALLGQFISPTFVYASDEQMDVVTTESSYLKESNSLSEREHEEIAPSEDLLGSGNTTPSSEQEDLNSEILEISSSESTEISESSKEEEFAVGEQEDTQDVLSEVGLVKQEKYEKYVSILEGFSILESLELEKPLPNPSYKNQTFFAKDIYYDIKGVNYLSLYDNKGKILGYINELGITIGNGDQGAHQNYGEYVSIKGTNDCKHLLLEMFYLKIFPVPCLTTKSYAKLHNFPI